jgi:co-chaperonin GroES (HSP10)
MKVKGKIKPLRDRVFVSDMEFGEERTKSGIFIPGADGKTQGIMARWGKVWAVGPEQTEITIGQWVLIEHGRWTRTVEFENDNGVISEIRMIDNNAIIATSDERPSDVYRAVA